MALSDRRLRDQPAKCSPPKFSTVLQHTCVYS